MSSGAPPVTALFAPAVCGTESTDLFAALIAPGTERNRRSNDAATIAAPRAIAPRKPTRGLNEKKCMANLRCQEVCKRRAATSAAPRGFRRPGAVTRPRRLPSPLRAASTVSDSSVTVNE